jgi:hypothetical protein
VQGGRKGARAVWGGGEGKGASPWVVSVLIIDNNEERAAVATHLNFYHPQAST